MKHIYLLEGSDVINPNDFMRPLARSADFDCISDAWQETSCYGGGPLDYLRWARVYMVLGAVWWGSKYQEYQSFGTVQRPYEFARGEIPLDHQLTGEKWEPFHPLYHRKVDAMWAAIKDKVFERGKYQGYSLERVQIRDPGYLEWAGSEWNIPLMRMYDDFQRAFKRVRTRDDEKKYLSFPETDNIISVLNI